MAKKPTTQKPVANTTAEAPLSIEGFKALDDDTKAEMVAEYEDDLRIKFEAAMAARTARFSKRLESTDEEDLKILVLHSKVKTVRARMVEMRTTLKALRADIKALRPSRKRKDKTGS